MKTENSPTGCLPLDRLLHGGFQSGEISLLYGEAATGKTTIAIQTAVNCTRRGLNALYVDADKTFPCERLKQICGCDTEIAETAKHIGIFTPKDFFDQTILVENLEAYVDNSVGLIVFDTINSLYSLDVKKPNMIYASNKELNRQLAYLLSLSKTSKIPILLTSRVHSILGNDENDKVEPVATRTLNYWSRTVLHLESNPKPNVKRAILEKFGGKKFSNVFSHFSLTEHGAE